MSNFVLPRLLFTMLNVSFSRLITRELFFLLSITRSFVVSVRRSFFFLWVLRKGCVI